MYVLIKRPVAGRRSSNGEYLVVSEMHYIYKLGVPAMSATALVMN